MTKKELKRLGVRFILNPSNIPNTVQVHFTDWRISVRYQLRLVVQNGTEAHIARPAKGSFQLGYDWWISFPLKGIGIVGITKILQHKQVYWHNGELQYWASILNEARKELL